jgi:hypothetical protein
MKNINKEIKTFEEFIKLINKIPDRLLDGHFKSQHLIIEENIPHIDFIGKLENFSEDWKFIKTLLGYKEEKIEKKSVNNKYCLKEYYTPELKEIIYKKYIKDFKLYGYSK